MLEIYKIQILTSFWMSSQNFLKQKQSPIIIPVVETFKQAIFDSTNRPEKESRIIGSQHFTYKTYMGAKFFVRMI